jgi:hypothetical protein
MPHWSAPPADDAPPVESARGTSDSFRCRNQSRVGIADNPPSAHFVSTLDLRDANIVHRSKSLTHVSPQKDVAKMVRLP